MWYVVKWTISVLEPFVWEEGGVKDLLGMVLMMVLAVILVTGVAVAFKVGGPQIGQAIIAAILDWIRQILGGGG